MAHDVDDAQGPATAVQEVTGQHLLRALDDLLDASQALTRALLGVPADQSDPEDAVSEHYEGSYEPGVQVVETAQQYRARGGWLPHHP